MLYRPVGNDFLDQRKPLAFWKTEKGVLDDFPDSKEVKRYTEDELKAYCKQHGAMLADLQVY